MLVSSECQHATCSQEFWKLRSICFPVKLQISVSPLPDEQQLWWCAIKYSTDVKRKKKSKRSTKTKINPGQWLISWSTHPDVSAKPTHPSIKELSGYILGACCLQLTLLPFFSTWQLADIFSSIRHYSLTLHLNVKWIIKLWYQWKSFN